MVPHWLAQLWPRPPLGLDAVRDSLVPQPIPNMGNPVNQIIHLADKGSVDRGVYLEQAYNVRQDHSVLKSLAREPLMSWFTAAWRLGGPGYPSDYGYGPGAHYDCMTPQFYMKPGVSPMHQGGNPPKMGPVNNFGVTAV